MANLLIGIEGHAKIFKMRNASRRIAYCRPKRFTLFAIKENILISVQMGIRKLLKDNPYAAGNRVTIVMKMLLLTVNKNITGVRLIYPPKDFH